ncbi:MAG: OsmC family protein [Spirochaetota bacterium]
MAVKITGRSTGATTMELVHESGAIITTMAPKDNGGDGSAFSPTDLCAASLGACGTTIMALFARDKGIPVTGISFTLEKEMASGPRRIARLTIAYLIAGELTETERQRIEGAGRACPVRVTLGDRVEIVESYEFVPEAKLP